MFALCCLVGSAPAHASVPPVPPAPRVPDGTLVEFGVDTSALDEQQARRLQRDLGGALNEGLNAEGFEVVNDGASARIEAVVTEPDVEMSTYEISVALIVEGERRTVYDRVECLACTEAEVVARSLELVMDAAGEVPVREPEPTVEPEPEPDPIMTSEDNPALPEKRRKQVSLGVLGFSGVLTIAGGVGLALGGAGMLNAKPSIRREGATLSTRGFGGVAVGVGVLAAGLGVTALLVDMKVLERKRHNRQVDLAVDVSKHGGGLFVSGRF